MTAPSGVGADAVLAMFSQVVREHQDRVKPVAPGLQPVILEEIERWESLLPELAEAALGSAVLASRQTGPVDVGADPRVALALLVSRVHATLAELAALDPASYAGLTLAVTPTTAQVTGPTPLPAANHAQRALRTLLTSVFHLDLRASDLPFLIWDDSPFDRAASAAVFRLVRDLPALLDLLPAASLVLVVGNGTLSVGAHCTVAGGLRHRLTARDGLQTRQSPAAAREAVRDLARLGAAQAPLVVMMFGAGTSASAGLPLGDEVRDHALTYRLGRTVDADNFREAGLTMWGELQRGGRLLPSETDPEAFARSLTLERVLREEQHEEGQRLCTTLLWFRSEHDARVAALRASAGPDDQLRLILARQRQFVIVQVNFDKVVEARAPGLTHSFVTEAQLRRLGPYLRRYARQGGKVPLIKLHGDIALGDTLVANTDETAGGLSAARLDALSALRRTLGPVRPWWYVGYSMRDLDLNPVFSAPSFADGLAERWVSPFEDPAVGRFLEQSRLSRWSVQRLAYTAANRQVSLTADDFLQLLHDEMPT